MTRRESRVINAFINCVRRREYTLDYAITLIEDQQKYGWLSDEAKDYFYDSFPEPATVDPSYNPNTEDEGIYTETETVTEEAPVETEEPVSENP